MSLKKYLNSKKYISIARLLFPVLALGLTFTSCNDASANTQTDLPATLTATPVPDDPDAVITGAPNTPETTLTPTPTPAITSDAATIARQQVLDFLSSDRYSVSLLSDELQIGSDKYYTFLVSLKGVAIEPFIIVNQKTNELRCISSDNVVSEITSHPLYQKEEVRTITWEGSYTTSDDYSSGSYLTMKPVDATRFEFTVYTYPSDELAELSGVAQIHSDTASFTSESGTLLDFAWSEDSLILTQSPAGGATDFSGVYHFVEDAVFPSSEITEDAALQRLLTLTPEQAELPDELSEYCFYIQQETEIIHDHRCYHILVYLPVQNRLTYIAQFYITVDGNKIYRLEGSSEGNIEIYSIRDEESL